MLRLEAWPLSKIAEVVGGVLIGDDTHVSATSSDTRTIPDGALFVPLVGERFDGHDFLGTAVGEGARAAFVSRDVETTIPVVRVDDTLQALQRLGSALWKEATAEGLLSIALTGSNGKTTTKELISALWRSVVGDSVHATSGNLNNHIGVPLTLCALPMDARVAVIEMGANHFGDIDELIRLAPAQVRVVTSIGAAHLEFLGDLDGVRRVKGEIFGFGAGTETIAVAPANEMEALIPQGWPGRSLGFGEGGDLTFSSRPIPGGQEVLLESEGVKYHLRLGLPGRHNASNLAAALATLLALGEVPTNEALQVALQGFALPGGRLRHVERGRFHFIDDAYNANPTSVRASFEAFQEIAGPAGTVDRPRIAVVGEMKEVGGDADRIHASLAEDLASASDGVRFIFVGPYAKTMSDAATARGATSSAAVDIEEATAELEAQPDEVIVWLKGSRGARLERIIDQINVARRK